MVLPGMDCAWAEHPSAEASSAVASLIIGVPPSSAVNSLALANVPGLTGRSAGLVRQVLISGKIHRDGLAADLKSADAIHRDWPVARQVLDPARQGSWRVHLGAWQHVRAPWQVPGLADIQKHRPTIGGRSEEHTSELQSRFGISY